MRKSFALVFAGSAAGIVNGLLGAGGGMVLVPLLSLSSALNEDQIFPVSVSIILPICITSLLVNFQTEGLTTQHIIIYLLGSAAGGVFAGLLGKKIPTAWLHRALGILILFGGIRYLC